MKFYNIILDYVGLTVPNRLILSIGMFIVFSFLFKVELSWLFFYALCLLMLADSASSILNSVTDFEVDIANKKNRPLGKKSLNKKNAVLFFVFLSLVSLLLSLIISSYLFSVVILRLLSELVYSYFKIKKVFPLNYIFTGIAYGIIPLLFSLFLYPGSLTDYIYVIYLLLVLSVTLSPLKDIFDFSGDKKYNVKTFSVISKNDKVVEKILLSNFLVLVSFSLFFISINSIWLLPAIFSSLLIFNFFQFTKIAHLSYTNVNDTFTVFSMLLGIEISFSFVIFARWLGV